MQTNFEENYIIETIPDEDILFYRVHKTKIDQEESDEKKKIMLIAFDPQPKGCTEMSTDWSKYSSAFDTQNKAKIPTDNGVLSFIVSRVRNAPFPLEVRHDPVLNEHFKNKSHALISSVPPRKNDIGIRLKLRDICNWEIIV
jgi:hypothetical protein